MSLHDILQSIYDSRGELTPRLVVDEAAAPDHPLHHRFEWDDSRAGELYRLNQAAGLIRSVNVVIEKGGGRAPVTVRAFVAKSEIREDDSPGKYLPVTEVVADDITRTAWFQALRRDWERLRRKAGMCQEFADMVLADLRDEAG